MCLAQGPQHSDAGEARTQASMANSVDPDQTAPIGAVCSGFTLFASTLNLSVIAAADFSRQHFQMHFYLCALRVNSLHAEWVFFMLLLSNAEFFQN